MIKTFDTFNLACEKGRCPRRTIVNKKTCARQGKRERCFDRYTRKLNSTKKKEIGKDEQWEEVRRLVRERDEGCCRFVKILSVGESKSAHDKGVAIYEGTLGSDTAHVIRRSQSSRLYYDPRNLVTLQRIVHQRLDTYRNPLTGKSATREETDTWWKRLVGLETWNYLQENK